MQQDLVGLIYETSFFPELWPTVLDSLAKQAGARGGVFFAANKVVLNWTASVSIHDTFRSYVEDGWLSRCTRRACWLCETRPGFLVEHDIWTEEELDRNPIYRDFLRPHGLGWSAGMALPLPTGDTAVLTLERDFANGPVDRRGVERLNVLRPHLARSALIAARLNLERASVASATLDAIGLPAMVVTGERQVVATNERMEGLGNVLVWRGRDRVALRDPAADALLWAALLALPDDRKRPVQSFPVRDGALEPCFVGHIVPIRGSARDIFADGTAMFVLTPLTLPKRPSIDLLRSLFDLTPAEARIASGLVVGLSVEDLAEAACVTTRTVRSQLQAVMRKTGCSRQAEIVALLSGLSLDRSSTV